MKVLRKVRNYSLVQPSPPRKTYYIMDRDGGGLSPIFGRLAFKRIRYLKNNDFMRMSKILLTYKKLDDDDVEEIMGIMGKMEIYEFNEKRCKRYKEGNRTTTD